MPTVLCHCIWMDRYAGPEDEIFAGGFDYAVENGYGHELFNFLPVNGACYGYVQVKSASINIDRLGAEPGDTFVDDVTVIWTAPRKEGGRFVVGWYQGARVYRDFQQGRVRGRFFDGSRVGYLIQAPADRCFLVPSEARSLEVPHHGKGLPGTSSVFYPEDSAAPEMATWLEEALSHIADWKGPSVGGAADEKTSGRGGRGWPLRPDAAHNALVEAEAIAETKRRLGEPSADRQKDNCGWDLEFVRGGRALCVEVKGLSGANVAVELTPNEYAAMERAARGEHPGADYRLAVVTGALSGEPVFHLFAYAEQGIWRCKRTGRQIKATPVVAARLA